MLVAAVVFCPDFAGARQELVRNRYDFLVTNLRLRAFNGLHLVYLAKSSGLPTQSIVYTERREVALAREVQAAGAFYELRESLPYVIGSYVAAALPSADRRDAAQKDRREVFRGGRRSSDMPSLAAV
jgi:hypothetical protein